MAQVSFWGDGSGGDEETTPRINGEGGFMLLKEEEAGDSSA